MRMIIIAIATVVNFFQVTLHNIVMPLSSRGLRVTNKINQWTTSVEKENNL